MLRGAGLALIEDDLDDIDGKFGDRSGQPFDARIRPRGLSPLSSSPVMTSVARRTAGSTSVRRSRKPSELDGARCRSVPAGPRGRTGGLDLCRARPAQAKLLFREAANRGGDLVAFFLEREVAGVQEYDLGVGNVAEVGLRSGEDEEGVVLTRRRPAAPSRSRRGRVGQ